MSSKVQEAQDLLSTLQLPPGQQNEIAALTLLVLAQLDESSAWSEAMRKSLRIHDILQEIHARYGREYAENTRETVRRRVIHQFIQARLVDRNPDEPDLPTNSPKTHYALSIAALQVIRRYNTPQWSSAVQTFLNKQASLQEQYARERAHHMVPLVYKGKTYRLSPGDHNQLQVAIIESFAPRFAPGATLLYLGDTADKTLILDKEMFAELKIPLTKHDKLPDVMLYDEEKSWLFLIEAVTSHGPVTPKRTIELEQMLSECDIGRVYVSAFPDFSTFRSFIDKIAWETEVWLSEIPEHMIHFNGDRFLGPRA